jgi:hypothetical protein
MPELAASAVSTRNWRNFKQSRIWLSLAKNCQVQKERVDSAAPNRSHIKISVTGEDTLRLFIAGWANFEISTDVCPQCPEVHPFITQQCQHCYRKCYSHKNISLLKDF